MVDTIPCCESVILILKSVGCWYVLEFWFINIMSWSAQLECFARFAVWPGSPAMPTFWQMNSGLSHFYFMRQQISWNILFLLIILLIALGYRYHHQYHFNMLFLTERLSQLPKIKCLYFWKWHCLPQIDGSGLPFLKIHISISEIFGSRLIGQRYQYQYGESIPCEQLVSWLCDIKQVYLWTCYYWISGLLDFPTVSSDLSKNVIPETTVFCS